MCCSEIGGVAGLLLLHPSGQGTTLVHSSMLQYTALWCTALHIAALHCTLHSTKLQNETGESWAIIENSVWPGQLTQPSGIQNLELVWRKKTWMWKLVGFTKSCTCDKNRFASVAKLKSTQSGNHDINLVYDSNKSQVDICLKANETKKYTNLTSWWWPRWEAKLTFLGKLGRVNYVKNNIEAGLGEHLWERIGRLLPCLKCP